VGYYTCFLESIHKNKENKIASLIEKQHPQKGENKYHKFYTRTKNLTNIYFSEREYDLLNKGLQHNIHYQHKHWLMQLAIEAEAAISKISLQEQDYYRYLVAHNIKKLEQGGRRKNKHKINEWKIMK
jgi:hypothetical protein